MPFVLFQEKHPADQRVANLSTQVIPEFYTYKTTNVTEDYEWFEAVDCMDYYTDFYGSFDAIPYSL